MNNKHIGVFDSGVGGLTVLKELKKILPYEHFIYFGDTKNLPYGEKTQKTITEFSDRICSFLVNEKKCKAIVIACNSASANSYEYIKNKFSDSILIIDVIKPTVNFVLNNNFKKIGLIATRSTINSGIYKKSITQLNNKLNIFSLATPLLVNLIEEGFLNDFSLKLILEKYLYNPKLRNIDSLILGCTHYPILKDLIKDFFKKQNKKIEIITSGIPTALELEFELKKHNLLNHNITNKEKEDIFYISDYSETFSKMAKVILKKNIIPEIINI